MILWNDVPPALMALLLAGGIFALCPGHAEDCVPDVMVVVAENGVSTEALDTVGLASDNIPPWCSVSWEPAVPEVDEPTQLHANAVDLDGTVAGCFWDFGDGHSAEGCDPIHVYTAAGQYTVYAVVVDDQGAMATCSNVITVVYWVPCCLTLEGNCWHLITLPCSEPTPDPWEVFDELRPPNKSIDLLSGNLHRYNRNPDKYVTYWHTAPSEFGSITPGDGYWLWLFEDETICYDCRCGYQPSPQTAHFPDAGWHLMGSPQPMDTYLDDTEWYQGQTCGCPFSAVMNLWVQDPLIGYSCDYGRYTYTGLLPGDDDQLLRQFQGYWMYTFEPDVTIWVPPW